MTYTEVKEYINTWIITNGNREITAAILNPVLQAITDLILEITGVKDNLNTVDKSNLVNAINEVNTNLGNVNINSSQVYYGVDNPNITPPTSYNAGDFYLQQDLLNEPIALFIYDGFTWQNLTNTLYNNKQVKIISTASPYTLLQDDAIKFLVLTTAYDVVLPLELESYSEFWIKNISGSEREITFDVDIVFKGSALIPDNGICVLKKLYTSGGVETWSVNVISEGGGGSVEWGDITGTLSSQTDLQTALNGKQATLTETNFGSFSNGLNAKTTLVDADLTDLVDSADSNKAKKVTWLNVWNYIKSKADAIYQATLVSGTNIKTLNGNSLLGSGNLVISGGAKFSIFTQAFGNYASNGNWYSFNRAQAPYDAISLMTSYGTSFTVGTLFTNGSGILVPKGTQLIEAYLEVWAGSVDPYYIEVHTNEISNGSSHSPVVANNNQLLIQHSYTTTVIGSSQNLITLPILTHSDMTEYTKLFWIIKGTSGNAQVNPKLLLIFE